MSFKVAVIGGGVIGMSTAVILQERIEQAEVTVIAEDFLEKTVIIFFLNPFLTIN